MHLNFFYLLVASFAGPDSSVIKKSWSKFGKTSGNSDKFCKFCKKSAEVQQILIEILTKKIKSRWIPKTSNYVLREKRIAQLIKNGDVTSDNTDLGNCRT